MRHEKTKMGERVGERGSGKPRLDACDSAIDIWAADFGYLHLFALLDGFTLSVATRANLRKELQLYLRLRDRLKGLEALPFSRERESERRNTCVRMLAIKERFIQYIMKQENPYYRATPILDAIFGVGCWREREKLNLQIVLHH